MTFLNTVGSIEAMTLQLARQESALKASFAREESLSGVLRMLQMERASLKLKLEKTEAMLDRAISACATSDAP